MPESTRLSSNVDQFVLEFVEREATPRLLMKLGIQLHLVGLSLSNTVSILEILGVERALSPYTIGFTKPIYSPAMGSVRITLRLTKP